MNRSRPSEDLKDQISSDFKRKKIDAEAVPTERGEPSGQLASPSTSKSTYIFDLNGVVLQKICSYCSVADLYAMATCSYQLATFLH